MKRLLLLVSLLIALPAFGQTALYEFKFADDEFVSFLGKRECAVYLLPEGAAPKFEKATGRKIIAANYISGIKIRTNDSDRAADVILNQLADAIGIKISLFSSSRLEKAKPSTIMSGIGKHSVWSIFITPADSGDYIVTISYVIEEENGG